MNREPRQRNVFEGLLLDWFAGGGGASIGMEMGSGRTVDIACNHDPEAVLMHEANHPYTKHYCESVWDVDPLEVTKGQHVDAMWFSPDCKHFSVAKGGKPVEKKIRALAWIAIKWGKLVRPDVIFLENVYEFTTWGPLLANGKPCPRRKGQTFTAFVNAFKRIGYNVEWKKLLACNFGAPTARARLVMIARCDGQPIVWPEPTHFKIPKKGQLPWRTAAECIDWSIPVPSIFGRTKKPLKENSLRRIAKGVQKFVLEAANPFLVTLNHSGEEFRGQGLDEPAMTVTASRDDHRLVVPTLIQVSYGERPGQEPRVPGIEKPLGTVVAGGIKHALSVAALMHYRDAPDGVIRKVDLNEPLGTITAGIVDAVLKPVIIKNFGGNCKPENACSDVDKPMPTVTATDHNSLAALSLVRPTNDGSLKNAHLVAAFLMQYNSLGLDLNDPINTIVTHDQFAIVTVTIHGELYMIVDIGMRMLQPHELYKAQGFPEGYIIAPEIEHVTKKGKVTRKPLSKTAQVRMCGNSVPPPLAAAIVEANIGKRTKQRRVS